MKKAVLLICFGNRNIDKYVERIKKNLEKDFEDVEVFYSFISKYFVAKYGFSIEDSLNTIYEKGYKEVIVQPLFTVDGVEYQKSRELLEVNKHKFGKLYLGNVLLSSEDDIDKIRKFIKEISNKNTLYICHGTDKKDNEKYEKIFASLEKDDIFFANLESYPYINDILSFFKERGIKELELKAFLLFKGKHIEKDILGDKESSIKNIISREGINLKLDDSCLLDYDYILDLLKEHIKSSIAI